jgi:uncharacterized protein (DUF433 family)
MREIVQSEEIPGGDPRLDGTRIGVIHIRERLDTSNDSARIAADCDVTLADVYHALAYYYDNPAEMDGIEARREAFVEGIRRERPDPAKRT